jgi:hypothetical protein
MNEKQFEDKLENLLRAAGIPYRRRPSIGGLRPDFIVAGPRGEKVVLEVKAWDPREGNTARAMRQVNLYKEATGADQALIVIPDLKKNYRRRGVIKLEAVVPALQKIFRQPPHPPARGPARPASAGRMIFAAMPFSSDYDDTFFIAMAYAARRVGAACRRVDRSEFSDDIVAEIKRLIAASTAVIVDLSEGKPNVLYEAGFAHALNKPTVHICSTPLAELPFDVRNWNTLPYRRGQTALLREPLSRRLRAVMGKKN